MQLLVLVDPRPPLPLGLRKHPDRLPRVIRIQDSEIGILRRLYHIFPHIPLFIRPILTHESHCQDFRWQLLVTLQASDVAISLHFSKCMQVLYAPLPSDGPRTAPRRSMTACHSIYKINSGISPTTVTISGNGPLR